MGGTTASDPGRRTTIVELDRRMARIAIWHEPSTRGYCKEDGQVWPCRTVLETGYSYIHQDKHPAARP